MKSYMKNRVDFRYRVSGDNGKGPEIVLQETLPESYKLFYVYSGNGQVFIDGKCFEVEKGDSFLVFPIFVFEIVHKGDMKYVWLEFMGLESAALLSRVAFTRSEPVLKNFGKEGLEQMFEMPDNTGETYLLYRTGGRIMVLLSYYIERYPSKTVETQGYVYRACKYIDSNYTTQGFGVKDVVEHIKIDRSHLYRLFKDEMGVSVIDYITRRRVSTAEALLANAKLPIKEVAYSSGFSDQMYFSRVFKKLSGRTPTEFREMKFQSE